MTKNKNPFSIGDKVCLKNDPDKEVYIVYELYGDNEVSLGLLDYPEIEQDYVDSVEDLVPASTV